MQHAHTVIFDACKQTPNHDREKNAMPQNNKEDK